MNNLTDFALRLEQMKKQAEQKATNLKAVFSPVCVCKGRRDKEGNLNIFMASSHCVAMFFFQFAFLFAVLVLTLLSLYALHVSW